jgi:hypothetical protein
MDRRDLKSDTRLTAARLVGLLGSRRQVSTCGGLGSWRARGKKVIGAGLKHFGPWAAVRAHGSLPVPESG